MTAVERAEQAHPYPPGTRVFHAGQLWARSLPGGTGQVIRAEGPDLHGDWEYLVRTGEDFSRRPGTGNPETRETWWSSRHACRAQHTNPKEQQP